MRKSAGGAISGDGREDGQRRGQRRERRRRGSPRRPASGRPAASIDVAQPAPALAGRRRRARRPGRSAAPGPRCSRACRRSRRRWPAGRTTSAAGGVSASAVWSRTITCSARVQQRVDATPRRRAGRGRSPGRSRCRACPSSTRLEGRVEARRRPCSARPEAVALRHGEAELRRLARLRAGPRRRWRRPAGRPRCRSRCPETTSGRSAACSAAAISSARARDARPAGPATAGAAASSAWATAKPRRARSSGAARYVCVATSSSFVAAGRGDEERPFLVLDGRRGRRRRPSRGCCSFAADLHAAAGGPTGAGPGRASARCWSRPRPGRARRRPAPTSRSDGERAGPVAQDVEHRPRPAGARASRHAGVEAAPAPTSVRRAKFASSEARGEPMPIDPRRSPGAAADAPGAAPRSATGARRRRASSRKRRGGCAAALLTNS